MPRNQKYWKNRFGDPFGKTQSYYHHLDLRHIDDLDDIGFAYIMEGVKGVDMLDLNELEITNESIRLLAGLDYVKELQLKGCSVDNDCVKDLNTITSLELLHLKNTNITIDGLLHLDKLTLLKTLMFSAEDVDTIKEKLLQLKNLLPQCDFVINSKPYYFDPVERFIYAVKAQPYTYRLKIKNESLNIPWSNWVIKPSDSYYETENQGPFPVNEIEWIEVDPIEERKDGKLITVKLEDHTEEIEKLLEELSIPYMEVEEIIRIYIVK
ncbi:MAG: hypothetical protein IPL54_00575 [Chitinophagaceae bacterium]|nr:hypothetical protein [Chitinophagaceae bacterium]